MIGVFMESCRGLDREVLMESQGGLDRLPPDMVLMGGRGEVVLMVYLARCGLDESMKGSSLGYERVLMVS